MVAVELPHCNPALVVPPQDIALAVTVEVADAGLVPIASGRSDGGVQVDMVAVELPDCNAAAVVAEQDIADAVAVEIVGGVMGRGGDVVVGDRADALRVRDGGTV